MMDDNNQYVALAYNGTESVPIKVDPVTGRLLIEIHYLAEVSRTINPVKIDDNNESTSLALGDDGEIYPLQIDSRNGNLLVDIE